MAHHAHFVQGRLPARKVADTRNRHPLHKQILDPGLSGDALSILEMTLHNPTVLKKSIRSLVVPQIDTLERLLLSLLSILAPIVRRSSILAILVLVLSSAAHTFVLSECRALPFKAFYRDWTAKS